jgi:hypothetical protein
MPRWISRAAGGWGLPGPGIRRPAVRPVTSFTKTQRLAIRPGEGTLTATVSAAGTALLALGPDALITWYLSYVSISTTTGVNDNSTCTVQVGPYGTGINPAGVGYSGGGDTISLGGRALKPGEYVVMAWAGGNPGDLAIATAYGDQDILI